MHSSERRHAFLILAHDKPLQLKKLTEALSHPAFDLYVHLDVKAEGDFSILGQDVNVGSKFDISWGGFAMIEATLFLLRRAHNTHDYWTYTLLSGTDYPVKSNARIYDFLTSSSVSFIDHWHDEDMSWHRRYKRYFFHDWSYPVSRVLNGLSRRISRWAPDRKMPEGIKPYFGSQWWMLHREGVVAVFDFIKQRPDFVRFMKSVHIPDEMFFQTALMNTSKEVELERKACRYLDWSEQRMHPKILTFEDLDSIMKSECLFARKFDETETPDILEDVETLRKEAKLER